VFVRVGPIVIGIDASMDHLTDAQLETFVDVMVERAQAALAGAPIPR
jgi:hypothetical protein